MWDFAFPVSNFFHQQQPHKMVMKLNPQVIYCGGPGDIAGTMCSWLSGQFDESEVACTYSSQFFDQIRNRTLSALVISTHARTELFTEGSITVEHRPNKAAGNSGCAYKIADILHWLGVIGTILHHRPRAILITDCEHWWLLTIPAMFGINVITDLHCTFWPRGYRTTALYERILQGLNGWFWRNIPIATICISPECERQVHELASGQVSGSLLQARSSYKRAHFSGIILPVWQADSFRLMFAGRVERNKGVFDLLEVMSGLLADGQRNVSLEICGGGTALGELKVECDRRGLDGSIRILGRLNSSEMRAAYERCHMVVVPTTAHFAEGMNKVVVEGVLSGRPVVATAVCPAVELLPRSVIAVEFGDQQAMVAAIKRLACDKSYYESIRANCAAESEQFYDRQQSWGAALSRALDLVFK